MNPQQLRRPGGRVPRPAGRLPAPAAARHPQAAAAPGILTALTITVGTNPFGLDVGNGKLYVANNAANTVSVIDTATDTVVVPAIPVGEWPYDVAVAPNGKAYVTNSSAGTVSVIDTATDQVLTTVAAGDFPAGAAAAGDKVYTVLSAGNAVAVIDTVTDQVADEIPVGENPIAVAVAPNGKAYVTNSGDGTVSVIDAATGEPVGQPVPVGSGPFWVAAAPNGKVYVTGSDETGTVTVIDSATDQVLAVIPVDGVAWGVAAGADGTVRVAVPGPVPSILLIDSATDQSVGQIATADPPYLLAVAPGNKLYATNAESDTVTVLIPPVVADFTPSTGSEAGGETVLITGSGFTGATGVTIAGVPAASFTVNSDTGITAVTAPGSGSGPVVVTGPEGAGTSSGTFTYTLLPATTTTTLEVIPDPAGCGEDVTLRATVVTGTGAPVTTGSVTFILSDDGPVQTVALDASGQASAVFSGLDAGGRQAAAFYTPADTSTTASNSPLTPVTVQQVTTTTTVVAVPASSTQGQPVQLTATVAPATSGSAVISGTVTFTGPGGFSQTVPVNAAGVATVTTSALPVGANTVTATYSGDGCFTGSTGTVTVNVTQPVITATRLVADPATIRLRRDGTFVIPVLRATLTNAVTGAPLPGRTITFTAAPLPVFTVFGSAVTDANGTAVLTDIPVPATMVTASTYQAVFTGTPSLRPTIALAPLVFRPVPLL
ncbi:Ig-like domain repeat protein [Streptomyces sp. F63]|uniref:Ig-like domain repeat protein n=1 Tax=Streptomyces sp. F63 TaxID=2824887 RepID=UPI001B38628B|nr:Ig-like domain repeat protein [Streptomyces sp. F63]MBQ0984984.1 Ig-like domain repeat protein [Streptomyces sp. F63]